MYLTLHTPSLCVSVVTIFLAVQLSKAELPEFVDWILVAFVAFYVAIHLILSVSTLFETLARIEVDSFYGNYNRF